MAAYSDIRSLLDAHLNSYSAAPPIAWENLKYTPAEDELYFQVFLNPQEKELRCLGANGPEYNHGVFHVNVCGVRGDGWGQVAEYVDDVLDLFSTGTVLENLNLKVRIEKSWPSSGYYSDSGRFVVPINIRYFSYNFN